MNPYNFAMLFFSACSFILGLLIFLKRKDSIARAYFIFSIFVTLWGTFWSIMVSDNVSYATALTCSRLSHSIGGLVGVIWFHFCLLLSDQYDRYRKLLHAFYLISCLSIFFFATPFYVPEVIPIMSFKHYTRSGPILDLYMAVFVLSVGLGFLVLNRKIDRSSGEEKTQLCGLFFATLAGFTGGLCTILPIYGIQVPPYSVFVIPVYPFVMAYFLIRHRLFDVEQAVEAFQREKLATIGLIASSINHEIRNPLYAAKCILENDLEAKETGTGNISLPVPVSSKQSNASERALKQISRALDVITKLNRFAKPAEDRDEGKGQRANIQEALKNVLDLVSYEFSLDQIQIKNEIPNDLPDIQADQRQLEEILFNLIVNACHAMLHPHPSSPFLGGGEEGVKKLESCGRKTGGTLELRSAIHDTRVTLTIIDTGCGITPNQAKHLFEPFHTTKGDKGTGLGLYITKQLVERNGGRISVKSKEGDGAKFMLEFSGSKSL